MRVSLENLRGFPWIAELHGAGRLTLEGFYFDIAQAALYAVLPDRLDRLDDELTRETGL